MLKSDLSSFLPIIELTELWNLANSRIDLWSLLAHYIWISYFIYVVFIDYVFRRVLYLAHYFSLRALIWTNSSSSNYRGVWNLGTVLLMLDYWWNFVRVIIARQILGPMHHRTLMALVHKRFLIAELKRGLIDMSDLLIVNIQEGFLRLQRGFRTSGLRSPSSRPEIPVILQLFKISWLR